MKDQAVPEWVRVRSSIPRATVLSQTGMPSRSRRGGTAEGEERDQPADRHTGKKGPGRGGDPDQGAGLAVAAPSDGREKADHGGIDGHAHGCTHEVTLTRVV
jgi:hypothetical protein